MPDDVALHHPSRKLVEGLALVLLALLLMMGLLMSYLSPHGAGKRIGVGDVLTLAKDKRVEAAVFRDEDSLIVGKAKKGNKVLPEGGTFSASLPSDGTLTASLTALLAATGTEVRVDPQEGKGRAHLMLTTLVPVLVLADLVGLLLVAMRRPHGHGPSGLASDGGDGDLVEARELLQRAEGLLRRHGTSVDAMLAGRVTVPPSDEGFVVLPSTSLVADDGDEDDELGLVKVLPPAKRTRPPVAKASPAASGRTPRKAPSKPAAATTSVARKAQAKPTPARRPKAVAPEPPSVPAKKAAAGRATPRPAPKHAKPPGTTKRKG